MSSFWHWFVIILTSANILGCLWLLWWTAKKNPGESVSGESVGHVWDGNISELNNPMPRWWLWLFYITVAFAVVYLILYPGMGNFAGVLGWTQVDQHAEQVAEADAISREYLARFEDMDIPALARDPGALRTGGRLYAHHCALCHGTDARGLPGFPNLTDNEWQWGGEPDQILATILDGRSGMMPALGAALGEAGVQDVTAHVLTLSGRDADPDRAAAGAQPYAMFCAACHGPTGDGNTLLGAPDLTNDAWLYGGSVEAIMTSIQHGRHGVMPPHRALLGEERAKILAAWVYSLSHADD